MSHAKSTQSNTGQQTQTSKTDHKMSTQACTTAIEITEAMLLVLRAIDRGHYNKIPKATLKMLLGHFNKHLEHRGLV